MRPNDHWNRRSSRNNAYIFCWRVFLYFFIWRKRKNQIKAPPNRSIVNYRMKYWLILSLYLLIASKASTQECREKELIRSMNTFTAPTVFNTYGLIGSIMDGFNTDAYKEEEAINLLKAQSTLLVSLSANLDSLVKRKILTNESDINYSNSISSVIMDLKRQSDLAIEYFSSRSGKKRDAFIDQREKNWKSISKLMDINSKN